MTACVLAWAFIVLVVAQLLALLWFIYKMHTIFKYWELDTRGKV